MENEKRVANESEVLETLTRIMRREVTEDSVVKLREETKTVEDGRVVTQRIEHSDVVRVRPKLQDVIRAAELIGKAHGIFSEKVEGSITLPLIICGEEELK